VSNVGVSVSVLPWKVARGGGSGELSTTSLQLVRPGLMYKKSEVWSDDLTGVVPPPESSSEMNPVYP
jgi:hypothetical protein